MGGRGRNWGRGSNGRNGLSLPASDWVTFLVDFSYGLFIGFGPRQFL